jgi:hypothetical protein
VRKGEPRRERDADFALLVLPQSHVMIPNVPLLAARCS